MASPSIQEYEVYRAMIRYQKPLVKSIPFLNSIQSEIVSVLDFAEMSPEERTTQLQCSIERVKLGFRAINDFTTTVMHLNLVSGIPQTVPLFGIYSLGLIRDSFEQISVKDLAPSYSTQGLNLKIQDQILSISSIESDCMATLLFEFELEVL